MDIKFNCTNEDCRRRLAVDEALAGGTVKCPACGAEQQVPASRDVRFHCTHPGCGQHIVADVAETGRFTRCPGCGKPVQVPGPPPRTAEFGQTQRIHARVEKPGEKAAQVAKRLLPRRSWFRPLIRLAYGWGVGLVIVGALYLRAHVSLTRALPDELVRVAEQIYSRDFRDAPIVNDTGSTVLYTYIMPDGARLYRVNPTTLERAEIDRIEGGVGPKDFKWIGWSPGLFDAAYFVNRGAKFDPSVVKSKELVVLEAGRTDGRMEKRVFDIGAVGVVESGFWLTPETLALSSHTDVHGLFNLKTNDRYGEAGLRPVEAVNGSPHHWMARDSEDSIAYAGGNYILSVDLRTGETNRVLELEQGRIQGLHYSSWNRKYLFSIQGESREECSVYEYGPRGSTRAALTRLTSSYATNTQWIKDGTGFACAGTNSLAVHTREPELRTNLFVGGVVRDYSVSPFGDKIYAVAAERSRLMTVWEYDINARTLRNLLPLEEGMRFVAPVEAVATNQQGESVSYYYVPPALMDLAKKYPVVLDANLANRYDQSVQFVANAGIFFVSAGAFGITDWRSTPRYEETLAVYRDILRHPNVDPERVYLSGMSLSTHVASQLVSDHPDYWRGVLLLSPVALPFIHDEGVDRFPSVFITIGDRDTTGYREKGEQFVLEASRRNIPAWLDYQHAPHAYATPELMLCYQAAVRFIRAEY